MFESPPRNLRDGTPARNGRVSRRFGPVGAVSAALALGLALALGAGEAAAQVPDVCAGVVTTGRTSPVVCDRAPTDARDVRIDLRDPAISAGGFNESAIVADLLSPGHLIVEVTGGSLTASGAYAKGIRGWANSRIVAGDLIVRVKDVDMTLTGLNNNAIFVRRTAGTGNVEIDVSGGSIMTTTTGTAIGSGVFGHHQALNRPGDLTIAFRGGSLLVNGLYGDGVHGQRDVGIRGEVDMIVADASVETRGRFTRAISGISASRQGDIDIDVSGNSVITAEGEGGVGVYAAHTGTGSVHVTIGAETRITAPFSDGVHGRLTSDADAAGRVVIASGAAIEARDAGILAFAEPRGGSTFGEGNEAADETARTAPMIHVTSSGDITVGEGVMDAYIRAVVAGADETLSAGEQAVLDAIAGGDSDALTTALDALPDDYDDAWKARIRAFQTARVAELTNHHRLRRSLPGNNAKLAEQAAIEILDIPRAGIRAMALSHTEIADFIRRGGLGGTLSDDERTVLAAVLTGGDLEAALAALPADYTDEWKDGVRLRAMSYNAGDIQVDVTGGMIASEGDGVHALYAVPHDRNGAIAVTVAEGASVTGGRHGVHLGGAGLDDDGRRAHTVTVNGMVMGGTGAGVNLAGCGTVMVGENGRVSAASGVGIRSHGSGHFHATVAGVVEGDIRRTGGGDFSATISGAVEGDLLAQGGGNLTLNVMEGGVMTGAIRSEAGDLSVTVAGRVESDDLRASSGGALTLNVLEGGVVTGTVHDPAGPLTVHGSIGRLLYANGATVTVAGTGRLTGVEGETIRSEAGDLSMTVAGRVESDLRAPTGGALTLDVQEGGAVTGTVHDPIGPLTVAGSIGRLLYTNGATVTVAATGKLTGVEVDGGTEALRSAAGDLTLTVAGTVTGDVFGRGAGEHTVTVSDGGTVTGAIHLAASTVTVDGAAGQVRFDNGGAVTVGATGRIAGIEGVGIRSETGDLTATVAGTVAGDVLALGAGAHRVTVAPGGAVLGTVQLASAGGMVAVGGAVGKAQLDQGGTVTVGPQGRVTGVDGVAIARGGGELKVEIQAAPGEAPSEALLSRVQGRIETDAENVSFRRAGETAARPLGRPGTGSSAPDGAFDVGIEATGEGGVRIVRKYAPRSRVYEALPSVLLGLNGPSEFRARTEAPRSSNGVWARVEASGGSREAKRSMSASGSRLAWTQRRHGVETGVDFPLEADGVAGLSAHHRRGSAEVSGKDGGIEVSGTGLGASMAWRLANGVYVDGRTSATWYEARLKSGPRGTLKSRAGGFGHAVSVEAGRRMALVPGPLGGLTLTPRARVVYSRVTMDDFTDVVGARVSLDEGSATTGLAGVRVEASDAGGNRLFGSVDVERAFSRETRVTVSGAGPSAALSSQGEAARVLLEVGGAATWGAGRYTLQGAVRYTTGARDYGGGANLKVRF